MEPRVLAYLTTCDGVGPKGPSHTDNSGPGTKKEKVQKRKWGCLITWKNSRRAGPMVVQKKARDRHWAENHRQHPLLDEENGMSGAERMNRVD